MFSKENHASAYRRARNVLITLFVIFWTLLFQYESLRAFYLSPLTGQNLPKFKLLFPPAGWIMFYEVRNSWVTAEVYGSREGRESEKIDSHRIFPTRFVGFDNIRRNIMVNLIDSRRVPAVCRYLRRKFPEYERISIMITGHDPLTGPGRTEKLYRPLYSC